MLDSAFTELKTFSENFGGLLQNNRAQIDRTVSNLAKIIELVRTKLPTLDNTVLNLDDASKRLFTASRSRRVAQPGHPLRDCRLRRRSRGAVHPACPVSRRLPRRPTGVDALRQLIGVRR